MFWLVINLCFISGIIICEFLYMKEEFRDCVLGVSNERYVTIYSVLVTCIQAQIAFGVICLILGMYLCSNTAESDTKPWSYPIRVVFGAEKTSETHTYGAVLVVLGISNLKLMQRWLQSPALKEMGRISFSFYLCHGPVMYGLGAVMITTLQRYGVSDTISYWISFPFVLGTTLRLSKFATEKIDIPSISIMKGIEDRARAVQ